MLSAVNVLIFAALIMLHSVRASYLAFLILTPVILLVEFKMKAAVSIAGLLLAGALVVGGLYQLRPGLVATTAKQFRSIVDSRNGSTRGRMVFWKKAVQVFAEHPVNGIGYRHFNRRHVDLNNPEFNWSFWHAHGEYISMLAETGLIGTIAWLAFKVRLLVIFFRQRKHWIGAFMLYLLLAFEIHNIFECYLYERIVYIYIFVLFGLGLNQMVGKRKLAPCSRELQSSACI